jgi:hypothetical protein
MQTSSQGLVSHLLRLHSSSSSSLHADPGRQQSSPAAILMVLHRSTKAWTQWRHQVHHHKVHCPKLPTSTSLLLQTMCHSTYLRSTQSTKRWVASISAKSHRQHTRASLTRLQTKDRTTPTRKDSSLLHKAYRCKTRTKAILLSQTMRASNLVLRSLQQSSRQHLPRTSSSRMSKQFSQLIHQVQHLDQAQHHHLRYLKVG